MDKKLISKLNQKSTLTSLKNKYQVKMIIPCAKGSVFDLLLQHDRTIGYMANKKCHINSDGWSKIRTLVKREVGFDLLSDSVIELSQGGRIETGGTMKNEKVLAVSPQSGYALIRLLGADEAVCAATSNLFIQSSPERSYFGAHIDNIEQWSPSRIIVIENFAAFTDISNSYLQKIAGISAGGVTLVIYRGDAQQNIYAISERLSAIDCPKYVFADYDLSGLSLAETILSRIKGNGYILPSEPEANNLLLKLSKDDERIKQSSVVINNLHLNRYYLDLKNRFLAVTQEALIAHDVDMAVLVSNNYLKQGSC